MYNFRYHLVSICSVFIALALGLLLGAAIAGSDLARSTSDSMIDSMLARFDELNAKNVELESLAADNGALADQYVNDWAKNRLDGRTIVTLLGSSDAEKSLVQSLNTNLQRGNAAVVNVTVNEPDFGLGNLAIREGLQRVLPAVQGEDYRTTLINCLVIEWSYSYTLSTADAPIAADAQIQPVEYPVVSALELENQTGNLARPGQQTTVIRDGIEPATPFQSNFYTRYSLTRALLTLGVISIDTNYQSLLEHTNPAIHESQAAALRLASAWHLPYAVNGLVEGLMQTSSAGAMQANSMGLALAKQFFDLGTNAKLPYPVWLKGSLQAAELATGLPNYYVVLVQSEPNNADIATEASANGLSCVTSPTTANGRYSVLALLSGAASGIYGEDRPLESKFPQLPTDKSGRAAFAPDPAPEPEPVVEPGLESEPEPEV